MNKRNIKFYLAPIGVAIGISVVVSISTFITRRLGIPKLNEVFEFIPHFVLILIGVIFIIVWSPLFITGIYSLGRRGAVGQSEGLVTDGIYYYVRNPMYSGISFTIVGIGFLLNETGAILAGILWYFIAFIQCKREEKELEERFGEEYVHYKNNTPRFIPDLWKVGRNVVRKLRENKN